MGWLFGKKEEEHDDDDTTIEEDVRYCQGCGVMEFDKDDVKFKELKQQTSDGIYNFLFCRKCYKMMKKGKLPPLIRQMKAQRKR